MKTLILCGRQNLAIRGKDDENSNFMELLNFRAETDKELEEHLANAPANARYTSHRIQNELIQICGDQIRDDKLAECRNAPYFSLIVDETTDISVKEQVSFVLLYLDKNGKRHEEFVGFEETADTTGQTLYDLICKKLLEWNLDKEKVVGLGFDGAANMSGKFKGMQARFASDVPIAQYRMYTAVLI